MSAFDGWSDEKLIAIGRKAFEFGGSTSKASQAIAAEMERRGLLKAPTAPPVKVTVTLMPKADR